MTRFIILMIACLGLAGCGDDDRTATDVINSSSSSEEYSSEQDPDEESGNQSEKTDMASRSKQRAEDAVSAVETANTNMDNAIEGETQTSSSEDDGADAEAQDE